MSFNFKSEQPPKIDPYFYFHNIQVMIKYSSS